MKFVGSNNIEPSELLTRDQFREAVFKRDGYTCVICGTSGAWSITPAETENISLDAHHIMERRLFPDGGYYLDNGATVCDNGNACHMKCEQTLISVEEVREAAGITRAILPPHLYRDQRYDKWGNPIQENGLRLRGELYDDESVQKVLGDLAAFHPSGIFTKLVKYPRTYHLPWSPGATDDDRVMEDPDECFGGREVVVTEKMDGENCTMYSDYIHARSLDYSSHPSRDRVKAMWAQVAHDIPEGWRVCGENLYAEHSIHYEDLSSYFQVFSIWNEKNECLSWDETKEWAALLGFQMVPTLDERSIWRPETHHELSLALVYSLQARNNNRQSEGYVVRLADRFHYKDFRRSVAKYVRKGHVIHRDGHWSTRPVVPNDLKSR